MTGFVGGKIYLSFKPLKVVDGLLVYGGRVLYAGPRDAVAILAKSLGGNLVDLHGKTVIPGFIDAHLHLDSLGLSLLTLDLRGVGSIEELKGKLKEYATTAKTKWILGHGWDHELFKERRWPTRWDIDEVVPDKPVLLTRACLHAGVLNTSALELTGLSKSHVNGVLRDSSGNPTGIVVEEALKIAREKVKGMLGFKDYLELVKVAQKHLLSQGITTVGFVSCGLTPLKALLELWRSGELNIRVRVYLNPVNGGVDIVSVLRNLGVKAGFGDDRLKIMGVKLFLDGALGARTAWLSEPYSDDPQTSGYPVMDLKKLEEFAKLVDEAGLQLAVHAIGDKAVKEALNVLRELPGTRKLRHRVEHVSLIKDDDLKLMAELGATAVVQPHFVISDWWAMNRLGRKRVRWLYRFKSLIDTGIPTSFSTDAPVEPVNPWETVYAAVTRGRYENVPFYEDTIQESLNTIEALHAYTYGSAYVMHDERELGSLEQGKFADLLVIDRDPLSTPERELRYIRVLEVYVGGARVWPK
ncbi:MAG: amidohydrolase [Desulfurococcaceae archaeon]